MVLAKGSEGGTFPEGVPGLSPPAGLPVPGWWDVTVAGVPAQCVWGAAPLALAESLDGSAAEILTLPVKPLSHLIPALEPAWRS